MHEFNGWFGLAENIEEYDEGGLGFAIRDLRELLSSLFPERSSSNAHLDVRNGTYFLMIGGDANHKSAHTDHIDAVLSFLCSRLPASWGLLYERSDEWSGRYERMYRVRVLARGKVTEHGDPFLSPWQPVIENVPGDEGRTPLHDAVLDSDEPQVVELLGSGMDPNAQDDMGYTPLHYAAQQGSVSRARALVEAGANIDSVNALGNTPLWVAVFNSRGRGDMIRFLRSRGANPLHLNNANLTPVALARYISGNDVAQFFSDLSD